MRGEGFFLFLVLFLVHGVRCRDTVYYGNGIGLSKLGWSE